MKEVIPFYKEIVFKNNIANITSISLEHTEKVLDGEVTGEFIVFGDYKIHNDTTEKETFKYKLPFTAIIPDNIDTSTVSIDISNFSYEQIDIDVLRIDIDFIIEGEESRCCKNNQTLEEEVYDKIEKEQKLNSIEDDIENQINEILSITKNDPEEIDTQEIEENQNDTIEENREEVTDEIVKQKETIDLEKIEKQEEYITYHVHIVNNNDSIENIIKKYNTNLELLNEYNDIKELKIGDKVIIPECNE